LPATRSLPGGPATCKGPAVRTRTGVRSEYGGTLCRIHAAPGSDHGFHREPAGIAGHVR
jgi:hypothetical protein